MTDRGVVGSRAFFVPSDNNLTDFSGADTNNHRSVSVSPIFLASPF